MKMIKRFSPAFISVLLLLSAACAPNANAPSKEKSSSPAVVDNSKDTFVVAISADQGTLDPAVTMDNSAWKITYP
ncbi:MAG: ABC transporter substrate-binding protein, partial [Planifilum fimeticola]